MTPEEKQRIDVIQIRHSRYKAEPHVPDICYDDIDFLLSIVEKQEAQLGEWESHRDGIIELVTAAENAAISMRSACIEKVRERLAVLETQTRESNGIARAACQGRDAAIRDIITELETLTLQEQDIKTLSE